MSSPPLQNSFQSSTTPMEDPHQPPPSHSKTYELKASSISYAKITTATIFTSSCTYQLPKEYILTNISFTARPSELLAVVGPSGAGKSTLLDILAARTAPTEGQLKLNSTKFNSSAYRKISAHVPQHDYCLPHLTVEETFAFATRLLNTTTTTTTTIVMDLLSELNLTHLSNSRLSDHISGGERRRVSIGLALLHDPAILLLDEPTSGLDSSSAFQIMQTLKKIAQTRQRTVIVTIHQPSFKILDTIDSILLLYKGSVLHHGTLPSLDTYLLVNGYTVPPQLNSLEYAMEIVAQLHEAKPTTTPQTLVDCDDQNPSFGAGLEGKITYRCSRVREITTLYVRFWRIMYRTRQLLMTNFLEAVGVGLLLGTLYIHVSFDKQGVEKRLGFFAFTLTFLLSSTTEALPIFINERPVLLRETASGVYRLSSHVIANTLVFLPYLLVMAFMYSASVYFLVGLCATWQAFGFFVLVTWVVVLMANSFVLFLSSLAPNYIAGTSLLTMSLAGFFLFSGYFIAKDKMPKYWLFMNYFSLYKYPLDALIENEYSCSRSKCFQWSSEERSCAMTGRDILDQKGLHEGQRWTNIQIMVGYFLLYRILYWAVLARRVSMSKK